MKTECQPFNFVWSDLIAIVVFVIAFWAIPIRQLDGFQFIPGDIGDSRLNNYFLEHVYQFVIGRADSLWHLPFFAPFPYVGGFSDNHFGTSIFYVFFRFLGAEPFDAFQLWFLLGYFLNFFATYYVMRRLGGSPLAAAFAALVFAFALPTTAHANHVQLHYRFAMPLSVFFFLKYLYSKKTKELTISMFWMLWQFYCGIYMGFFTGTLLAGMFISNLFYPNLSQNSKSKVEKIKDFINTFKAACLRQKVTGLSIALTFFVAFAVLLFPYLMVKLLYSFDRSWSEISLMMPRPLSYFLSDVSTVWGGVYGSWFDLPNRHEHQMFPGLMVLITFIFGLILAVKGGLSRIEHNMIGSILIIIVSTISIYGFTIWYFLHFLPIASAIRAMTRVDQALLLPLAYLSMQTLNWLVCYKRFTGALVAICLLIFTIFEFSAVNMPKSPKVQWQARIDALESRLPSHISGDVYLFIAQEPGVPFFAHEIDVMWVGMLQGVRVVNGYSGNVPPGYSINYYKDCSEIGRRVEAVNNFRNRMNVESLDNFNYNLIPYGFSKCD